jgi:hypothetical protein
LEKSQILGMHYKCWLKFSLALLCTVLPHTQIYPVSFTLDTSIIFACICILSYLYWFQHILYVLYVYVIISRKKYLFLTSCHKFHTSICLLYRTTIIFLLCISHLCY